MSTKVPKFNFFCQTSANTNKNLSHVHKHLPNINSTFLNVKKSKIKKANKFAKLNILDHSRES